MIFVALASYCLAGQQAAASTGDDGVTGMAGAVFSVLAVLLVSWYAKRIIDAEMKE